MNYSSVSHVAHDSYPSAPGEYPGPAPPPPPRPGYGLGPAPGPGYQGYFSDNYPPQVAHVRHSGPTHYPFQQPYDSGCPSVLRACLTTLCCCCVLEQCCNFW